MNLIKSHDLFYFTLFVFYEYVVAFQICVMIVIQYWTKNLFCPAMFWISEPHENCAILTGNKHMFKIKVYIYV